MVGMGGIRKAPSKIFSPPTLEVETKKSWAFLHVPIPIALELSLSSSSRLTLSAYKPEETKSLK